LIDRICAGAPGLFNLSGWRFDRCDYAREISRLIASERFPTFEGVRQRAVTRAITMLRANT
jgi:hypothetical protein